MADDADDVLPQRTAPLSVLAGSAKSVQNAILPFAFIAFSQRDNPFGIGFAVLIALVIVGLGILFSYLRWTRLTYRLGANDIRVESGILSRAARSVPYERIQDVSLEQSFVPRLLGLVEVKFETGAGGGDDLTLAYLREEQAEALREVVRERRDREVVPATADGEASGEPDPVLFSMGPGRLLVYGLFSFSLAVVAVLFGLTQQFEAVLPFELWDFDAWEDRLAGSGAWLSGLGPTAQIVGGAIAILSLIVVGFVTGIVRTFLRDWEFRLERTAKGFRRRRGLLTKTDVVMPVHRVQAVQIGTRILRRQFGWHGLKFVSLAQDSGSSSHDVAPFAKLAEIDPIIRAAGFEPPAGDLAWQRPSGAYRVDKALLGFLSMAVVAAVTWVFAPFFWIALIPLAVGVFIAFREAFVWRYERNALCERQLFQRSGWLAPDTRIANRVKLQSVEISQGPLARKRGYSTLHLGLAGGSFDLQGLPVARARELRDAVLASISRTDFSELV
ncbi:PH domain-containing protein [Qipengyuania sp. JC766]|uniref:PH domain-containing protein n=1 Tax=Qipengyuania sp. JC766 TaxID=3232139 RepID=UPI00345AC25D